MGEEKTTEVNTEVTTEVEGGNGVHEKQFSGLRIYSVIDKGDLPEVTQQQADKMDRIEARSFPVSHWREMGVDKDDWKFLRLLQVNPDVFLYMMNDWFGFHYTKTLNEMDSEGKKRVVERLTIKLLGMVDEEKATLLQTIQMMIPIFNQIEEQNWSDEWDGFTDEMVQPFQEKILTILHRNDERLSNVLQAL